MNTLHKIITIDGPSGVGKGTAAKYLATHLGWQFLDSGALYRVVAFEALKQHIDPENIETLVKIAQNIRLDYDDSEIRTQAVSDMASQTSKHPEVRAALFQKQHDFVTKQGLIADGRDMGTVVFPKAPLKFFLTASAQVRADRRHKQLQAAGIDVSIADLLQEINARDARDTHRTASPLKPAEDAIIIDTSALSIEDVFNTMIEHVEKRGLGDA